MGQRLNRWWEALKEASAVVTTPLVEKNVVKIAGVPHVPVIISMSRVIVLAFAAVMLRQVALAGIAGWPDATLSIAIVLALPLLGALDRMMPGDTVELAKLVFGRFGVGEARRIGSGFAREPSKYDDHRVDALPVPA